MRRIIASILRAGVATFRVEGKSKHELRAELRSRLPVVEVQKCANHRFADVTPYERAALVYVETGSRDAVRRCLSDIVDALRPECLADLLFGGRRPDLGPLNELSPLTKFQPWLGGVKEKFRFLDDVDDEAEMVVAAVDSLRRHGYQPEIRPPAISADTFWPPPPTTAS